MKQRKEIPFVCQDIPSLLKRGNGFVRYSDENGTNVGVYTSLHPFRLSSLLRVEYLIEMAADMPLDEIDRVEALVSEANLTGPVGSYCFDRLDDHNALRLVQLLWVDHRPSKESLEELLSAGDAALRALYAKTKKGEHH